MKRKHEDLINYFTLKEMHMNYPNWLFPSNMYDGGDCSDPLVYNNFPKELYILTREKDDFSRITAVDNTDSCCWIEDFDNLDEAISWLLGKEKQ